MLLPWAAAVLDCGENLAHLVLWGNLPLMQHASPVLDTLALLSGLMAVAKWLIIVCCVIVPLGSIFYFHTVVPDPTVKEKHY
jgi:hypothetical protein